MTRHLIRRPSRWQAEHAERVELQHREAVAADLASRLPPPLTDAQVLAFTGDPDGYVRTSAEAQAHAFATETAATYFDAAGALIVAVDEAGTIVERGSGRWP